MEEPTTRAGTESRRRLAVEKVLAGWMQKDVADFLGVHPVTVGQWMRAHRAAGPEALARKPHPGRKRFLSPAQEAEVLGWLAGKPTDYGFPTDLWTSGPPAASPTSSADASASPTTPATSANGLANVAAPPPRSPRSAPVSGTGTPSSAGSAASGPTF